MKTMKVIEPDGSIGTREVDYVERYDENGVQRIKPRSVPVVSDGEDIMYVDDETVPRIVSTKGRNTSYAFVYTS